MPYDISIEDESRLIVVHGHGDGTTADTLALIQDLDATLQRCGGYDFLYDALELRIESSPADMVRVANALFGEAGAVFRRFAIIVPQERVPLARMFTALADPHGVTANVFSDVASAREWLITPVPGRRHHRTGSQ